MAYASWSVSYGEQPSAAKWNILGTNDASFNDGTGIFGLKKDLLATDSNPYKFSAYRAAAWTDGSAAFAKITFDTETYDTNNNFATGTYTCPVTGFYFFHASASKGVTAGNTSLLAIYKNGVAVAQGSQHIVAATNTDTPNVTSIISCAATDTIDIYSYGTGGGGGVGATVTYFNGFLVCRT